MDRCWGEGVVRRGFHIVSRIAWVPKLDRHGWIRRVGGAAWLSLPAFALLRLDRAFRWANACNRIRLGRDWDHGHVYCFRLGKAQSSVFRVCFPSGLFCLMQAPLVVNHWQPRLVSSSCLCLLHRGQSRRRAKRHRCQLGCAREMRTRSGRRLVSGRVHGPMEESGSEAPSQAGENGERAGCSGAQAHRAPPTFACAAQRFRLFAHIGPPPSGGASRNGGACVCGASHRGALRPQDSAQPRALCESVGGAGACGANGLSELAEERARGPSFRFITGDWQKGRFVGEVGATSFQPFALPPHVASDEHPVALVPSLSLTCRCPLVWRCPPPRSACRSP